MVYKPTYNIYNWGGTILCVRKYHQDMVDMVPFQHTFLIFFEFQRVLADDSRDWRIIFLNILNFGRQLHSSSCQKKWQWKCVAAKPAWQIRALPARRLRHCATTGGARACDMQFHLAFPRRLQWLLLAACTKRLPKYCEVRPLQTWCLLVYKAL